MRLSTTERVESASRINRHNGSVHGLTLLVVVVSSLLASVLFVCWKGPVSPQAESSDAKANSAGSANMSSQKLFPVTIRKPSGPPRVYTGIDDIHGNPVTVSCSTCHVTRQPDFQNRTVADLDEFHGSLKVAHGNTSCLSCHNSDDYDALKLADGTRVEFTDVMTLCAQCHGPQTRDYEHGAHGGMNGYWDLSRGPRTRNNCVDCHNPHLPAFPKMQPTFKPRDRFLEKQKDH